LKTILVPGGDDRVRDFIAREAPVPVDVVGDPAVELRSNDLVVLIVERADEALQAAVARVLTSRAAYAVLVRRDVWAMGDRSVEELLALLERDQRRRLIRFWRDRSDLEQTIVDEVFALDESDLVSEEVPDGTFVKVGTEFEQAWVLANSGFVAWEGRGLKEIARDGLTPAAPLVPIPRTEPGEHVRIPVTFTAPAEPGAYRSVWKMADPDGRLCFPWLLGVWCQVLAVY
jgi:hypothetical protein